MFDLKELLDKQQEGFFIEAGAYDGEEFSNSLYFEKEKGWKGLLVPVFAKYYLVIIDTTTKLVASQGIQKGGVPLYQRPPV